MSISSKSFFASTIIRAISVDTVGIHVTVVIAVAAVIDISYCNKKEPSDRTHLLFVSVRILATFMASIATLIDIYDNKRYA